MLIVTTKELQRKNHIIENSLVLDISNIKEIINKHAGLDTLEVFFT